jgi:hypothetical protein
METENFLKRIAASFVLLVVVCVFYFVLRLIGSAQ